MAAAAAAGEEEEALTGAIPLQELHAQAVTELLVERVAREAAAAEASRLENVKILLEQEVAATEAR